MSFGKTATMKAVRPKKGGRPATGRDPLVQVRVPKSLLERIDRWAGRFEDMDRSAALRCLFAIGLNRSRSKAATVYDPKGSKPHPPSGRTPQQAGELSLVGPDLPS